VTSCRWRLTLAAAALATGTAAQGQTYETPSDPDEGQYPLLLDGTLSADGDLKEDNAPHSGLFRFPSLMDPWDGFKAKVHERTGITFGGSWGVLYQNYSEVPSFNPNAQRDAVGQKFTLNFSRDMLRRGTPEALAFDLVIEDRGPMGTDQPPLQAGIAAGSIVPTAATWGDFDLGITQAYIRQNLWGNKVQYAVGKIFAPNFVDAYPFFDDNRQFLNQSFATSPTIASPLRGAGAVATVYPTDGGLYVLGGVYSANSSDTGWTIDEVFDTGELFYQAEVGWSALARSGVPIQARGPMDNNNIHLTAWYKDSQPESDNVTLQPQARGLAFNANYMYGDNLMWFLRAGMSEGWVNDRAVSAGFGWRPTEQYSDLFGFGVGWVRPASDGPLPPSFQREQWNFETFYRFHLTPNFAITPDLQYIRDPSLNPEVDSMWVAGLRARVTF
jgi:carbohydrate-selective porin OprB